MDVKKVDVVVITDNRYFMFVFDGRHFCIELVLIYLNVTLVIVTFYENNFVVRKCLRKIN